MRRVRERWAGVGVRGVAAVAGSLVSTLCYAVTIRARLGLGPLYALQDGVARRLGISIGHAVMVVGVALVVIALVLRWRPGPFTLILPFFGGATLDALLPHLPELHGATARVAAVVAASWVMGLGGALMIRAAVGYAAYDGVMVSINRTTAFPLARIRLAMEATVLAAGFVLGGAIGVGTLVTGLLIGPALQFWLAALGAVARRPATAVPSG